ncbi:hypothetical protein C9383_24725 [Pseudomonas palleroniana]|uniref:Uncharacterized protein n=1 Tax=Pseudomonas palleroniana TaxID=191390 RepID=A0A2T4FFB3_9PSED|nr:hypothetical protein [Pseudomonas palleroniana]KAB0570145.1 hypothetical protein F7R03_03200 [Pseudomonas palleroniana]PTC22114.1 hypothetical protein C9383_24725 [Pseudomonas palleroniana]UOK40918.1 hypothetical protein MJP36_14085 [Pseudomonas palleroniana]
MLPSGAIIHKGFTPNPEISTGHLHHQPQPEITMLQLFLIGAALSHARSEPPPDDGLPTGPSRFHRERWRSRQGLSAFWR